MMPKDQGESIPSVKIDDPSFPAPVNARLIDEQDGTSSLYWSRRSDD